MSVRPFVRTAGAVAITLSLSGFRSPSSVEPPETVMVTYHAKAGSEDELVRVLAEHWSTAKRLGLVAAEPHIIVRSAESDRPVDFVEIFTWRDASIPDNAPETR